MHTDRDEQQPQTSCACGGACSCNPAHQDLIDEGLQELRAFAEMRREQSLPPSETPGARDNAEQLKTQLAGQKFCNMHSVFAVLTELNEAQKRLIDEGETYSIFLGKCGLTEAEQVALLEQLGEGDISLNYRNTDEPVEWYETGFAGIWVGCFHNHRGEATLRTVEVSRFPELCGADFIDVEKSSRILAQKIRDFNHD